MDQPPCPYPTKSLPAHFTILPYVHMYLHMYILQNSWTHLDKVTD
jgi:hypothetical protein